ncbi:unnamed protein product [Closterium sp. Yama58-4]|nr:unnamed protein product [Closterium sp. Yama58-4]
MLSPSISPISSASHLQATTVSLRVLSACVITAGPLRTAHHILDPAFSARLTTAISLHLPFAPGSPHTLESSPAPALALPPLLGSASASGESAGVVPPSPGVPSGLRSAATGEESEEERWQRWFWAVLDHHEGRHNLNGSSDLSGATEHSVRVLQGALAVDATEPSLLWFCCFLRVLARLAAAADAADTGGVGVGGALMAWQQPMGALPALFQPLLEGLREAVGRIGEERRRERRRARALKKERVDVEGMGKGVEGGKRGQAGKRQGKEEGGRRKVRGRSKEDGEKHGAERKEGEERNEGEQDLSGQVSAARAASSFLLALSEALAGISGEPWDPPFGGEEVEVGSGTVPVEEKREEEEEKAQQLKAVAQREDRWHAVIGPVVQSVLGELLNDNLWELPVDVTQGGKRAVQSGAVGDWMDEEERRGLMRRLNENANLQAFIFSSSPVLLPFSPPLLTTGAPPLSRSSALSSRPITCHKLRCAASCFPSSAALARLAPRPRLLRCFTCPLLHQPFIWVPLGTSSATSLLPSTARSPSRHPLVVAAAAAHTITTLVCDVLMPVAVCVSSSHLPPPMQVSALVAGNTDYAVATVPALVAANMDYAIATVCAGLSTLHCHPSAPRLLLALMHLLPLVPATPAIPVAPVGPALPVEHAAAAAASAVPASATAASVLPSAFESMLPLIIHPIRSVLASLQITARLQHAPHIVTLVQVLRVLMSACAVSTSAKRADAEAAASAAIAVLWREERARRKQLRKLRRAKEGCGAVRAFFTRRMRAAAAAVREEGTLSGAEAAEGKEEEEEEEDEVLKEQEREGEGNSSDEEWDKLKSDTDSEGGDKDETREGGNAAGLSSRSEGREESEQWSVRHALNHLADRTRVVAMQAQLAAACLEACGPLMASRDAELALLAADVVQASVAAMSAADVAQRARANELEAVREVVRLRVKRAKTHLTVLQDSGLSTDPAIGLGAGLGGGPGSGLLDWLEDDVAGLRADLASLQDDVAAMHDTEDALKVADAVRDETNWLLPRVHMIWPHAVSGLKRSHPALIISSIHVITALSTTKSTSRSSAAAMAVPLVRTTSADSPLRAPACNHDSPFPLPDDDCLDVPTVLVVLPDGSVRLYDTPRLTVCDVLCDYPSHALSCTSAGPLLQQQRVLNLNATYYLRQVSPPAAVAAEAPSASVVSLVDLQCGSFACAHSPHDTGGCPKEALDASFDAPGEEFKMARSASARNLEQNRARWEHVAERRTSSWDSADPEPRRHDVSDGIIRASRINPILAELETLEDDGEVPPTPSTESVKLSSPTASTKRTLVGKLVRFKLPIGRRSSSCSDQTSPVGFRAENTRVSPRTPRSPCPVIPKSPRFKPSGTAAANTSVQHELSDTDIASHGGWGDNLPKASGHSQGGEWVDVSCNVFMTDTRIVRRAVMRVNPAGTTSGGARNTPPLIQRNSSDSALAGGSRAVTPTWLKNGNYTQQFPLPVVAPRQSRHSADFISSTERCFTSPLLHRMLEI